MLPRLTADNERAYVMAAWRVNDWFQPSGYYAVYFPDIHDRKGTAKQQHDVALTLRFDLQTYWLFKLEGHYFNGTAQLPPALNDGTAKKDLKRQWGLLLAKTTAYF